MMGTIQLLENDLEFRVAAVEAAWSEGGRVDIARFLPPRDHPEFPRILAELIRVDLECRGSRGDSPRLLDYRHLAPDLFGNAEWLAELAFEEYRQRLALGETRKPDEYAIEFGIDVSDWPVPDSLSGFAFPQVGDIVGTYRILQELGRGSFGRVYLAEQTDLAGRRVALKVTSRGDVAEPETLARLQHTNIVPIYSSQRIGAARVIVMPFLGSTTLADVIEELHRIATWPATGTALADTIAGRASRTKVDRESRPGAPTPRLRSNLPLEQFRKFSHPEAVLWIGWKLADALAHAHDRGIYHRDIKPANVLLADDGEPMLLDFNLASDARAERARELGGTPGYMAPEQRAAMESGSGTVDARADLYSLGLVLAELLAGKTPLHDDGTEGDLRKRNPSVSPSTEAIIRKCLQANPADRYPDAHALAEDLHRQLTHRPLLATREPSVPERIAKWRRRHPVLASTGSLAALAIGVVALLVVALVERDRHVRDLSEQRTANLRWTEFRKSLPAALDAAAFGTPSTADERIDALLDTSGDLTQSRYLAPADRAEWIETLGELMLLKSRRQAKPDDAFEWNERAERVFRLSGDVPRSVWQDRHAIEARRGREREAREAHDRALATDPRARDWYLSGLAARDSGDWIEAASLFEQAVASDSRHYWSWLLLGDARTRLGQDDRAEGGFNACIALKPDLAMAYFNRGLCRHRLNRFDEAVLDFTSAMERGADPAAALLARGQSHAASRAWDIAEADYTAAIKFDSKETRLYFLRADVRAANGNAEGASLDRNDGLRRTPSDEASWVTRGLYRTRTGDVTGAMADYEEARKLNPASYSALMNLANLQDEKLHREADAIQTLEVLIKYHPHALPPRAGKAVLLARIGDRNRALAEAERCLKRDPPRDVRYQLAGVFALTSKSVPNDAAKAYELLRGALRDGYGWDLLAIDPDLKPLHGQPEFQRLLEMIQLIRLKKP
jgi:serine/threonine protein kinase/Tfp pilus assembly protein PilF